MQTVTIYSKPGCCLCDQAKDLVEEVRKRRRGEPFELVVKNIQDDARDFAEYRFAIPVIVVDGREIARYRLTEAQLTDALAQPRSTTAGDETL